MPQQFFEIIGNICAGVAGGLATVVATHFLTDEREKRRDAAIKEALQKSAIVEKKIAFIGFLQKWRTAIEVSVFAPRGQGLYPLNPYKAAYLASLGEFRSELEKIRFIFSDAPQFATIASRLNGLTDEDWKNNTECQVILKALDDLLVFITQPAQ